MVVNEDEPAVDEEAEGRELHDPVRMYLSQMGSIPLLTRDQEIRLAKTIELMNNGFRRKVLTNDFVIARAIEIFEALNRADLAFDRTVQTSGSSGVERDDIFERKEGHLQTLHAILQRNAEAAAGSMTTDFVAVNAEATVAQAVQALRAFDGDPESITEIYLLDDKRVLRGAVSLARVVMAQPEARLNVLAEPRVLSCPADTRQIELAEVFDKYNLHALPVVDAQSRMVGVVHADHVIAFLREKI